MKMTKHRQEIMDQLEHSEEALSAASIHAALPHINLVTIYRNLEYFTTEKVVKKLNLGEAEAQYEIQHEPHHHAICDECGKVIHFSVENPDLMSEFALPDFNITDLEITLHGTCVEHSKKTKVKQQNQVQVK